nr:MAG TPA: hypothetical protein [Caudoviricetes sp.]
MKPSRGVIVKVLKTILPLEELLPNKQALKIGSQKPAPPI